MRFNEAFHRLDHCIQDRMRAFRSPALSLALTDQDQLVHLAAFGYADVELKSPLRPDHLFAIGSMGKAFTGVACLQACDQGLMDLHAPVTEYLTWFSIKNRHRPITIHHLLTHSAGLPRGTDFSPDPRSEVFALREYEAGFAPGTHFSYSDTGYKVLGLVLQSVYRKPYADIIKTQILEPLGMDQTSAVTTNHLRPFMATGYRDLFDDRPPHFSHPLVRADWVETDSGDGCIVSTAADMARFARMLLNGGAAPGGRILSETSYKKMILPMVEEEGEAYSYGLYLFEEDGYRHAGHGGDVPGYESYLWLDLDNGLGTVVLMTTPYVPRASFIALEFLREVYLGRRLPVAPPIPDFTFISSPEEYAGSYHSAGCELELEAEEHRLILVCRDQRVVLEERERDRFFVNHPDWDLHLLRFGRDANGKVVEAFHGARWFTNVLYQGPRAFDYPPEWDGYFGHYRSHNPWATNFRVFQRKGHLLLSRPSGEEEVLVPLGGACFRVGEEDHIPDRVTFEQVVDGQALCAVYASCPYYRFFTP